MTPVVINMPARFFAFTERVGLMSADPLTLINTRVTPQSEQADPRQSLNAAGGYTFAVDDMARLHRFLTLGTTGGTYYTSEAKLTRDEAGAVLDLARTRGAEVVAAVVEVSEAGRAPRNNPALFALAAVVGLGDDHARKLALGALPRVARTGSHLFAFAGYVEQFRGWGRGLRRAIADWYTERDVDHLIYQAAKYQQREGWSHRDLLRLSHPQGGAAHAHVFDWICGRNYTGESALIGAINAAREPGADIPALVRSQGSAMSWEMLPSERLSEASTWEALIDAGLPQTALIRQLPRLTRLGVLKQMDARTERVARQLADPLKLAKARVHPVSVLIALRTYASGQSARGSGEWQPVPQIIDALDSAFYAAYGAVQPAGKRTMLALDVSGSMAMAPIAGLPLTPREASAALSLVTAAVEPSCMTVGFTSGGHNAGFYMQRARMFQIGSVITPLTISPRQRLDDAIRTVSDLEFGATDCAAPMLYALEKGIDVDTFQIYTDSETWSGDIHPHQALRQYREQTGINARLVVVAMTGGSQTIADPTDTGMLDVSGFDSAVPNLIADFSRGDI